MNSSNTQNHTPNTYPAVDASLVPLFEQADALKEKIQHTKDQNPALWQTIINRLRTDWTYHSNGIEGSTLSRGETHFFLTEGLTSGNKPFKDFLDAQNHGEAIDLLFDVVANKQGITESFIKEINALLLRGVKFTPAKNSRGEQVHKKANPGIYKIEPNHVEQPDGNIHYYVEPIHVTSEMQALIAWVNRSVQTIHPIHVAAIAHYNMVRIHPFDDGNGRGARILMNLILLHKGYFPAVVKLENKPNYLQSLTQADAGNLVPFLEFITNTLITTKKSVLEVLDNQPKSQQAT
jgi:Fic family protein